MKKLKVNKQGCSNVSSNCVLWGGTSFECFSVCSGDSVTEVVTEIGSIACSNKKDIASIKDDICEIKKELDDLKSCCENNESSSETPCNDCQDIQPNYVGWVYNSVGAGNTDLTSPSFTSFAQIPSYGLNYKTKVKGKYKITVDVDYVINLSSTQSFYVGILIDNQQPSLGAFSQDYVKLANNSKTLHFIVDVDKGVNLSIAFKKASSDTATIEKVKVIIEKVQK